MCPLALALQVLRHSAYVPQKHQEFPTLPQGAFPLPLSTQNPRVPIRVTSWAAPAGEEDGVALLRAQATTRQIKVTVRQFALTAAFALTCHKAQGCTISALIIGAWQASGGGRTGYTYVALSRVRGAASLCVMQQLARGSGARTEVDEEMQRLRQQLFQPTQARLGML
jgi:hypothetical protein